MAPGHAEIKNNYCVCLSLIPTYRMDSHSHYFEFIEKAFDGNMVVDITVRIVHQFLIIVISVAMIMCTPWPPLFAYSS